MDLPVCFPQNHVPVSDIPTQVPGKKKFAVMKAGVVVGLPSLGGQGGPNFSTPGEDQDGSSQTPSDLADELMKGFETGDTLIDD